MPFRDLNHVNPAEFFEYTMRRPSGNLAHYGYRYDHNSREEFIKNYAAAVDSMTGLVEEWANSVPVVGSPAIVGYLLDEINKGRTTLEAGTLRTPVSTEHSDKLAFLAIKEGAHVVKANKEESSSGTTYIGLGKYVLAHDFEYTNLFVGHEGPFTVVEFVAPELAVRAIDNVVKSNELAIAARQILAPQPQLY